MAAPPRCRPGRPATRNTQIYINLANNARNDTEPFTVLGTVVEGMGVIDSLYAGSGDVSGGGVRQGKQGPLERGGLTVESAPGQGAAFTAYFPVAPRRDDVTPS